MKKRFSEEQIIWLLEGSCLHTGDKIRLGEFTAFLYYILRSEGGSDIPEFVQKVFL